MSLGLNTAMSWINDEYQKLDRSPRALRRFGFLVGSVLLVLGGIMLWRHRDSGWLFLSPGALLLLSAIVAPAILHYVYRPWMMLALMLGWLVTGILLTIVFCLVVTPIGLLQRICGKRAVESCFKNGERTYWQPRTMRPVASDYEKQF